MKLTDLKIPSLLVNTCVWLCVYEIHICLKGHPSNPFTDQMGAAALNAGVTYPPAPEMSAAASSSQPLPACDDRTLSGWNVHWAAIHTSLIFISLFIFFRSFHMHPWGILGGKSETTVFKSFCGFLVLSISSTFT